MSEMSKESEFYKKLKQSLLETTEFPTKYMFKFIIPTDKEKFKVIEEVYDNLGAVIDSKPSKNGKYTSLTILVTMNDPDEIIKKYREVSKVEGVISL
jgi:putative lipoic acid-binding regulatory protein